MSTEFIQKFIATLHDLIKVKERQMSSLSAEGKKDSSEYKQIPFKLKYYRQWYNMLVEIKDWPVSETTDSNLNQWFNTIKASGR